MHALRRAAADFACLLSLGYAHDSALKLCGDRWNLTARQRVAVARCTCSDAAVRARATRRLPPEACRDRPLGIDGYNTLITIESALSEGVVLIGRDGAYRDLASIHGTYRKVLETPAALGLLVDAVGALAPSRVEFYLDRPVANSGRLKAVLADVLEQRGSVRPAWNIELTDRVDAVLAAYDGVIATSDSAVLDRCGPWVNLVERIVAQSVPSAWIVDLRETASDPVGRVGTLHHVEINVTDLARSADFWSWFLAELGYQPYQHWPSGRSWRLAEMYIVLVQADAPFRDAGYHRKRPGLNHLAFHARDRAHVDELTDALRRRGTRVLYEDRHPHAGGEQTYAVFFEDPDRIKVEVVAPPESNHVERA